MMFGDIALHSTLGAPLRATVSILANADEQLDDSCFSLVRPERQDDFSYLTQASLRLEAVNGRRLLQIRTQHIIREPFTRLSIQADCGRERISRIFTLLLDPESPLSSPRKRLSPALPAKPQTGAGFSWDVHPGETLQSIAAGFYPRQPDMQRAIVHAMRDANADLRNIQDNAPLPNGSVIGIPSLKSILPLPVKAEAEGDHRVKTRTAAKPVAQPMEKSSSEAAAVAGKEDFRLKLSSEGLDLSRLGKLSEEQRQQLREKQHLLDADDQIANMLSMKSRIMQLESEIGELRGALDKTNSFLGKSERLAITAGNEAGKSSPGLFQRLSGVLESFSLRALSGIGLILVVLFSAWLWWRRRKTVVRLDAELEHEFAHEKTQPMSAPFLGEASHPTTVLLPNELKKDDKEEEAFHDVTGIFGAVNDSLSLTEADTVLDEADLYLEYGWHNRAIELLQDYLGKHPDDVSLWKKLFEIYNAQGMKQEFQQLALRCQEAMDDSGLWVSVQKLGRQLDTENPLYLSSPEDGGAEATDVAVPEAPLLTTLDAPLGFVLDDKLSSVVEKQPEMAKENEDLNLDPIFPILFETTKTRSESGPDTEKGA